MPITAKEDGWMRGTITILQKRDTNFKTVGAYPTIIYVSSTPLSTELNGGCAFVGSIYIVYYTQKAFPLRVKILRGIFELSISIQIIGRNIICSYSLLKLVLIWRPKRRTHAKPSQLITFQPLQDKMCFTSSFWKTGCRDQIIRNFLHFQQN